MVNVTHLWSIAHLEKVKICIVDTGYDLGHPDLPGTADGVTGWDTGEATKGIWNIDQQGHGSHVAGTIGAIGSNNRK
jgi:serine protease